MFYPAVQPGHLGTRSSAQFAQMDPARYPLQTVVVDDGSGVVVEYFSTGQAWAPRLGSGQANEQISRVAGPARAAAAASIELPSYVEGAVWFPMQEGAGSTVVDVVNGVEGEVAGTLTNVWDNEGFLTLGTDNAVRVLNNSVLDGLFNVNGFEGELIVGCEIYAPVATTATSYVWGYGSFADNTVGGIGGRLNVTGTPPALNHILVAMSTALGGTTFRSSKNLTTETKQSFRRMAHWVFHFRRDRVWVDGYNFGTHSRSCYLDDLSAATAPIGDSDYGFRIGGRPGNAVGNTQNLLGVGITGVRLANFHAIRVAPGHYGDVPRWVDDLSAKIQLGVTPEVLSNG